MFCGARGGGAAHTSEKARGRCSAEREIIAWLRVGRLVNGAPPADGGGAPPAGAPPSRTKASLSSPRPGDGRSNRRLHGGQRGDAAIGTNSADARGGSSGGERYLVSRLDALEGGSLGDIFGERRVFALGCSASGSRRCVRARADDERGRHVRAGVAGASYPAAGGDLTTFPPAESGRAGAWTRGPASARCSDRSSEASSSTPHRGAGSSHQRPDRDNNIVLIRERPSGRGAIRRARGLRGRACARWLAGMTYGLSSSAARRTDPLVASTRGGALVRGLSWSGGAHAQSRCCATLFRRHKFRSGTSRPSRCTAASP